MKVSKAVFDELLRHLGPTWSNPEQREIIKTFLGPEPDLFGCDYFNKFIPKSFWESPLEYDVYEFFVRFYDEDDDVIEKRWKKYQADHEFSATEKDALKTYVKQLAAEDEGFSCVFTSEITYRKQELVMFIEDNGDMRDEDYSLTLQGIFRSVEEGVVALYSEGEFV